MKNYRGTIEQQVQEIFGRIFQIRKDDVSRETAIPKDEPGRDQLFKALEYSFKSPIASHQRPAIQTAGDTIDYVKQIRPDLV